MIGWVGGLGGRGAYRPWLVFEDGDDGGLVGLHVLVVGASAFQGQAGHLLGVWVG